MGLCTSRPQNESRYEESQWPGIVLAGATVEDSIAESDVKEMCCRTKMMQFETAGHSGLIYYKLYCTLCGTTKPDTKKASALRDRWPPQTAASTLPVPRLQKQQQDSSDGTVRDTKMPQLLVEDLPRRMTPWSSNHQENLSPIRQLLRPALQQVETTTSPRG